jgi:hypothetical protein
MQALSLLFGRNGGESGLTILPIFSNNVDLWVPHRHRTDYGVDGGHDYARIFGLSGQDNSGFAVHDSARPRWTNGD